MTTRALEKQRPRRVEIRGFEPKDYPRMVEISNLLYAPHRTTEAEARFDDEHFDKKYFLRRWVAEDPATREVVAMGEISHMPWSFHPQKFWMDLEVHPDWQRKGIGQAMYEAICEELRAKGAIVLRSSAQESKAESVRWLEKRGFAEKLRNWESHLDVATVDAARFASKAVIPDPDVFTPSTFEMFQAHMGGPDAVPDGQFYAKAGDRFVGLSTLWRSQGSPDVLYQGLTGVVRAYRGRGLAWALKMRTIAYA